MDSTIQDWRFARAGELGAIRRCLEHDPIKAMEDRALVQQIQRLRGGSQGPNRASLERVADAFRRGLLARATGRPPKLDDPDEVVDLARQVQEVYVELLARHMKRRYHGTAAERADLRLFAREIAEAFPESDQGSAYDAADQVLRRRVGKARRMTTGFGVAFAAAFFGISERHVRNLQKLPRT